MYIIKTETGYVKSSKDDTPNMDEAKKFSTKEKATLYAQKNIGGTTTYVIIKVTH